MAVGRPVPISVVHLLRTDRIPQGGANDPSRTGKSALLERTFTEVENIDLKKSGLYVLSGVALQAEEKVSDLDHASGFESEAVWTPRI